MSNEAAIAGACLLSMSNADNGVDVEQLITILADTDKCIFLQDKFLSSTGSASLASVSSMVSSMLKLHTDKVRNLIF